MVGETKIQEPRFPVSSHSLQSSSPEFSFMSVLLTSLL